MVHQGDRACGQNGGCAWRVADALFVGFQEASDSTMLKLYTNRALVRLKSEKWEDALADCMHVLRLSSSNLKENFYAGRALSALKRWEQALPFLQKASNVSGRAAVRPRRPALTRAAQLAEAASKAPIVEYLWE